MVNNSMAGIKKYLKLLPAKEDTSIFELAAKCSKFFLFFYISFQICAFKKKQSIVASISITNVVFSYAPTWVVPHIFCGLPSHCILCGH